MSGLLAKLDKSKGFSLVEMVMALAIGAVSLVGVSYLLIGPAKFRAGFLAWKDLIGRNDELVIYVNQMCSWTNTVLDPANVDLNCLRTGASCGAASLPIYNIRNRGNDLIYEQHPPSCSGAGCKEESILISLEPACPTCNGGDVQVRFAINPASVTSQKSLDNITKKQIENKWVYRDFSTAVFKTCHELRVSPVGASGGLESGFYWLDPDGLGGECPVQLYCDFDSDGDGWTLIVNSATENYLTIPKMDSEGLGLGDLGRLSDTTLDSLLKNVSQDWTANAKVEIGSSATGMAETFYMKIPTLGDVTSSYAINSNTCGVGAYTPANNATKSAGVLMFRNVGLGYREDSDSTGQVGFYCNSSLVSPGCGIPVSDPTCQASRLLGSVWIR